VVPAKLAVTWPLCGSETVEFASIAKSAEEPPAGIVMFEGTKSELAPFLWSPESRLDVQDCQEFLEGVISKILMGGFVTVQSFGRVD
jgi:hypothetical protein